MARVVIQWMWGVVILGCLGFLFATHGQVSSRTKIFNGSEETGAICGDFGFLMGNIKIFLCKLNFIRPEGNIDTILRVNEDNEGQRAAKSWWFKTNVMEPQKGIFMGGFTSTNALSTH